MNNTLYIVDGHSIIFRSYYAHIHSPLRNTRNENTSAIFGFFQTIRKIFSNFKPMYFIVALDSPGKSFRNDIYQEYKATRQKTPEDLQHQIEVIIEILDLMNMPHISIPKMEADDIIASLVHKAEKSKIPSTIISSDKDLFQLLTKNVHILRPTSKSADWEEIDETWLTNKYGLTPVQIHDYLAICGDTSDNIPGVKGLGEKSAIELLHKYQSLHSILENIDSISKKSHQNKLKEGKDSALLSYELITLKKDVGVPDISELTYTEVAWENAKKTFIDNNIYTFTKKDAAPDSKKSPTPTPIDEMYATHNTTSHTYTLVENQDLLDDMVTHIRNAQLMAIDTETDSIDPLTATPVGISISCAPHKAWYIPIKYPPSSTHTISITETHIQHAISSLFDGSIQVIMHNAKFDIAVLQNWNISCDAIRNGKEPALFDTMIAAWMCMPNIFSYAMDDLSKQILRYEPISFSSLTDDNNILISDSKSTFSNVPLLQACEYSAEDADVTLQLYHALSEKMQSLSLSTLFHTVEMPLLSVIIDMELRGILLNTEYLQNISTELAIDIEHVQQKIYTLCDTEFNINSTKQLQDILFNTLQLKSVKKTKTGYSTDISVLEQLAHVHPVPKEILKYRHLSKLKSTYTDALPHQVHPLTKRLHTTFHQTGTETGRISSINPNLQNIPVKDEWGKKIRSAFIPARDMVFLSADYSQIELMILAHFSQDANMLDAFSHNIDIHSRTASLLFGVPIDTVDEMQRRIAKTINFGVIYGMSAFRLSNSLQISQHDAKMFIESYFKEYSGVTEFIQSTIENTKKTGYTSTILGHIRPIPNIHSKNAMLRKASERIAVNTIIQGSAADIVKLAMLKVHSTLASHALQSHLIVQIHDELLLECPAQEISTVIPLVKDAMEQVYTLSIPLQVTITTGDSWGILK